MKNKCCLEVSTIFDFFISRFLIHLFISNQKFIQKKASFLNLKSITAKYEKINWAAINKWNNLPYGIPIPFIAIQVFTGKVNKIIISEDIWDTSPRIVQNQRVCAVYRFRKLGIMKKDLGREKFIKKML